MYIIEAADMASMGPLETGGPALVGPIVFAIGLQIPVQESRFAIKSVGNWPIGH